MAQDLLKSEKLYVAAAKNADAQAQLQLAIRYCRGNGVPLDRRKAVRWLERAAAQGGNKMSDIAMLCLLEKRKTSKLPRVASLPTPSAKVRRSKTFVDNRSRYYV